MSPQILAAIAAVGLIGAGVAGAAETRAFEAIPAMAAAGTEADVGAAAKKCTVNVFRNGAVGVANIGRQVLENGDCVCNVWTGPEGNNGSAEAVVTALLRDKECADAPAVEAATKAAFGPGAIGAAAAGVAGAGGLGLAASSASKG